METQTTRITDSRTSAVCDRIAERVIFQKMAKAVAPDVRPEDSEIVKLAKARASVFEASEHGARDAAAVCSAAADAPIVKVAERMARAAASNDEARDAAPADALMRAVERMAHVGQ